MSVAVFGSYVPWSSHSSKHSRVKHSIAQCRVAEQGTAIRQEHAVGFDDASVADQRIKDGLLASTSGSTAAVVPKWDRPAVGFGSTGGAQQQRSWFPATWQSYCEQRRRSDSLSYSQYHAVIMSALRVKEGARAVEVFDDMQKAGLTPNQVTYCSLISGLLKMGRKRGTTNVADAFRLWQQLRQSGAALDVHAMWVGLNVAVEHDDMSEVEAVLSMLAARGQVLDVKAYNTLLKCHCRQDGVDKAWDTLQRMKSEGVAPNAATYNTLISAFAAKGNVGDAERALEEALRDGVHPDSWTYTTLMQCYITASQPDRVMAVFDRMLQSGLSPTVVTYTTVMNSLLQQRKPKQLHELLQRMREQGLRPNEVMYSTLLKAYAAGAQAPISDNLSGILEEMKADGVEPTLDMFNTLMSLHVSRGAFLDALEVFHQLVSWGYSPDAITLTTAMQAFVAADQVDTALEVFESMQKKGLADHVAWNLLIATLAEEGRVNAVEQALSKAAKTCRAGKGQSLLQGYGAVVSMYARLGNVEAAITVLRQFFGIGGTPDREMYDTLLQLCVRKASFKRAMQVVRAMELTGFTVNKEKYVRMMQQYMAADAHAKLKTSRERNIAAQAVERFKWFLGLPNDYYDSSWP